MNGADHDENMEDGQLPQEDIIQTPYLPEQLELPAVDSQILQHVELLFALSTKVPEFLDEYVSKVSPSVVLWLKVTPGSLLRMEEWRRRCRRPSNS